MPPAKLPSERYRLRGTTRYLGVRGWEKDEEAKRIARLARKHGIRVVAQYDLAQNCTFLYVPETTYADDIKVIFEIEKNHPPEEEGW